MLLSPISKERVTAYIVGSGLLDECPKDKREPLISAVHAHVNSVEGDKVVGPLADTTFSKNPVGAITGAYGQLTVLLQTTSAIATTDPTSESFPVEVALISNYVRALELQVTDPVLANRVNEVLRGASTREGFKQP